MIYPAEGYHEYIEVLQAFGSPIRKLLSYSPNAWANKYGFKRRIAFCETFNNFVLDIDIMARRVQVRISLCSDGAIPKYLTITLPQNNALQTMRDPDGLRCRRQQETITIRATHSFP